MSRQHRILITGIAGFCGSHLAELLLEQDREVAGIEVEGVGTGNLQRIRDRIDLRRADIRDADQVRNVLVDVQPAQIYHLAALTKPPLDGGRWAFYEVNVQGTINLLEAVRTLRLDCSLLIAGSSAQYGMVAPDENPIREAQPFRPATHYGVSKAAQDLAGYRYWAATGLRVIRTRAFNIIGPRQSPQFAASAFARQVAEIEKGLREPILEVGNLEAQRDFVDVRDVVQAYRLALEQGEPGEVYNVCSGQAHSIRSVLEGLLTHSTVCGIQVHQDPERHQLADVPMQIGDYGKLHRRTGWQPQISFEQSLRDLLAHWRGVG